MNPDKDEIEFLQKTMRKHNKDRYEASLKHASIEGRDYAKRQERATRVQREVFEKGSKALGLDLKYLDKTHAKDNEAARALGEKQLQSLRKQGRKFQQAHKRNIRRVRSRKKLFENKRGNPTLTVCNWFATSISPIHLSFGSTLTNTVIQQGNLGENVLRTLLRADSSSGQSRSGMLLVEHDFVWQSDRDGMLNAVGWLNIIGAWYMYSPGACFRPPGAFILIQADLSVSQQISGQQTLVLTGPEVTILNERRETNCVGTVWTGNPASIRTGDVEVTRNNFPLQPSKAVLATATLIVQVGGWSGGEAMFDVESDPSFQYNVPSVWFIIDS